MTVESLWGSWLKSTRRQSNQNIQTTGTTKWINDLIIGLDIYLMLVLELITILRPVKYDQLA
jgi:hypothetical protein